MKTIRFLVLICMIILVQFHCTQNDSFPVLTGEYIGQSLPGAEPELFAPSIVSTSLYERDVAMMPDGSEIYFGVVLVGHAYSTIALSKKVDGRWTQPEVAPFATDPKYRILEPFISPDGQKFFFVTNMPDMAAGDTTDGDWDIWVMDRQDDGWGPPKNLGAPVNSDDGEFFPSVTRDGTIYFTRGGITTRTNFIYRCRYVDGQYTEAEKLGEGVNSTNQQFNAFIAPDESFIIVPTFGREDTHGSTDYYISFRKPDDTWSGSINMGDAINTEGGQEYSAYLSPDGKVLFFMTVREGETDAFTSQPLTMARIHDRFDKPGNGNPDIYWMDAGFIQDLKPEGF